VPDLLSLRALPPLAQVKLRECEEVLENDYFLAALKEEFVENARLFIFETYCRIHQCIDLRMLAGARPATCRMFGLHAPLPTYKPVTTEIVRWLSRVAM
jgi:hypothetical protein